MTKWSLCPSESFAQSWHLVEESALRTEPSSGRRGDLIAPQRRPGMKQWGPTRVPQRARDNASVPGAEVAHGQAQCTPSVRVNANTQKSTRSFVAWLWWWSHTCPCVIATQVDTSTHRHTYRSVDNGEMDFPLQCCTVVMRGVVIVGPVKSMSSLCYFFTNVCKSTIISK